MKKILFLGRGNIAECCLKTLLQNAGDSYIIGAICSNPNTNVWWKSNAIYKEALRLKIPFISNEKRNEDVILALIKSERIDTLISVQHWWILSEEILDAVRYQALNLHNAKLPEYKGYYTINHAIINGEQTYSSTIHWMAKEVDEGGIAFEETVPVSSDDTAISLYKKSCGAGTQVFERLVQCLTENKKIPCRNTRGQGHYYAKTDLDRVREIKNPKDGAEMDRKARALFFPPFEPAFYRANGKKTYVLPRNYKVYANDLAFLNQFEEKGRGFKFIVVPASPKTKTQISSR